MRGAHYRRIGSNQGRFGRGIFVLSPLRAMV